MIRRRESCYAQSRRDLPAYFHSVAERWWHSTRRPIPERNIWEVQGRLARAVGADPQYLTNAVS